MQGEKSGEVEKVAKLRSAKVWPAAGNAKVPSPIDDTEPKTNDIVAAGFSVPALK